MDSFDSVEDRVTGSWEDQLGGRSLQEQATAGAGGGATGCGRTLAGGGQGSLGEMMVRARQWQWDWRVGAALGVVDRIWKLGEFYIHGGC